ncbi:hypothetical protein BUALT_Bualt15G0018300 [Buddleja alternifolia]|uniref:Zinc finger CCCH domain-containing protein 19 n=1 Tax=Buddleja alternifolia TaxID=168488 RepID=A0AAV6WH71_9LAMI|nr:hypothetical protein BUALT_Bualt15G0018300 [Buddleja alternifolia]
MPMEGDEDSLSNVNKPYEPDTKDEKLEIEEIKSVEQCESVPELENHVAAEEPEFIVEAVAERIEPAVIVAEEAVAEEGDSEISAAQSGGPPLETKAEGDVELVDDAKTTPAVVGDTGDAPLSAESQMDARGDELLVDTQQALEADEGFIPVVDAKVEGVVTGTGIAQQFSELQMDGVGDELSSAREGMVACDYKAEREMGGGEKVEEVGGEDNELVENNTETDVMGDEADKDKGDVVANDSEVRPVEKPTGTEDEKVDPVVTDEVPITQVKTEVEMRTEVNAYVDVSEKEQVPELSDKGYVSADVRDEHAEDGAVADESLIPGTKMVEDVNMSMEALEVSKLDEPVNVEENREEEIVKEELSAGDIKTKTQVGAELELARSSVVEDIQLANAEVETETGTKVVDDEYLDEDAKIETEETSSDAHEPDQELYDSPDAVEDEEDEAMAAEEETGTQDSPDALQDEEDDPMVAEEETGTQDTEMDTETDVAESGKTSGGKPKRGKLSKSPSISKAKASSRKTVGEDVCFICFDGGELVLCDRRGCPKAYHPSCVNRDEAFFKSKGRWNCGADNPVIGVIYVVHSEITIFSWYQMLQDGSSFCYWLHTVGAFFHAAFAVPFDMGWHLCSICEKNARYMCYTCTYSLCKSCIKDAVISCVRGNKGFCETCMRTVLLIENNEQGNNDNQVDFDDRSSWEYLFKDYYIELKSKLSLSSDEITEAKSPRKGVDRSGSSKQESSEAHADANDEGSGSDNSTEDIKTIRSKRRKVGKQSKSTKRKEFVSTGVAAGSLSENSEWATKDLLEFVSHMKDGDTSVVSQYDIQPLLLEYIKRNKLRDPRKKSQIICDARLQKLFGKPRVGHFEMLKLLESHYLIRDEQNDDVQGSVVDTENNQLDIDGNFDPLTRGAKDKRKQKTRKKIDPLYNLDDYAAIDMHNISLIYLRRKLMEDLLEDPDTFHDKVVGTFVRIRISGSTQKQDLYRLVQVVGTSKAAEPYKVTKRTTDTMVEILNLDKTEIIPIDTISNQEFTEEECKRLRQSIKCGLISRLTVGEILDKATEIQAVRVNDWMDSEILRLTHLRDRASDMGLRKGYPFLPFEESVEKLDLLKTPEERRRRLEETPEIHADPKMDPSYESDEKESESEDSRRDAFMRSRGYSFIRRGKGPISPGTDNSGKDSWSGAGKNPSKNWDSSGNNFYSNSTRIGETVNENSGISERDRDIKKIESNIQERYFSANSDLDEWAPHTGPRSESFSGVTSVTPQASLSTGVSETSVKINESEKIWHYKDPSGKQQGPFSIVQLRKWNNTGYFPADLRIWKATEKEENSILLADALAGKFPEESPVKSMFSATNTLHSPHGKTSLHQERENSNANQTSGYVSKLSSEKWPGNDMMTNLPSPTPRQSSAGWTEREGAKIQSPVVSGVLSSPTTAVLPSTGTHSSASASVLNSAVHDSTSFSPMPNTQQGILMGSADSLYTQSTMMSQQPHPVQMQVHPPTAVQSVQPVINQNLPSGQPQGFNWGTPNVQSSSTAIQPNMHPPVAPNNASWSVGPAAENNTSMGARPENPNGGWGTMQQANPNMGWGNMAPQNMNWGPAMQAPPPGNTIPGWVAPPGNLNPGWAAPPAQGPMPGNGWAPTSGNAVGPPAPPMQGLPAQGNPNQGWGPPPGNQVSWGGEQNPGGGQFSGQGGGGRPWNRQSSFGGGGHRKRDVVCPYNAKGRCRKGNRCDYLHI